MVQSKGQKRWNWSCLNDVHKNGGKKQNVITSRKRCEKRKEEQGQGQFHKPFYKQLLLAQIPKAQKDSQVISVFLHFWDLHMLKLLAKRALFLPKSFCQEITL